MSVSGMYRREKWKEMDEARSLSESFVAVVIEWRRGSRRQ